VPGTLGGDPLQQKAQAEHALRHQTRNDPLIEPDEKHVNQIAADRERQINEQGFLLSVQNARISLQMCRSTRLRQAAHWGPYSV